MKRLLIGFATTIALATTGVAQSGEKWDMPTPYPDATFHTANIKQFAADVKAATDGALDIVVHSAGSLFKHRDIKNAVRGGQVPVGEFFMGLLANEHPVFGLDSLPFLATDYDAAKKLWNTTKGTISEQFDKQGLMVLFSVPWPPQGLYAKKEINSVDDMKGLKFRAYNANTTKLADLAGAVPTQIEVADLPQAFATGRVDAMITSPSTGVSSKAWDFLSAFHHIQAWIPKNVVVINKASFDGLSESVKQAVLDAAAVAEDRGWKQSMAETADKIAVLKEHGVSIFTPSAELITSLKDIGARMSSEWSEKAGEVGSALLKAFNK